MGGGGACWSIRNPTTMECCSQSLGQIPHHPTTGTPCTHLDVPHVGLHYSQAVFGDELLDQGDTPGVSSHLRGARCIGWVVTLWAAMVRVLLGVTQAVAIRRRKATPAPSDRPAVLQAAIYSPTVPSQPLTAVRCTCALRSLRLSCRLRVPLMAGSPCRPGASSRSVMPASSKCPPCSSSIPQVRAEAEGYVSGDRAVSFTWLVSLCCCIRMQRVILPEPNYMI